MLAMRKPVFSHLICDEKLRYCWPFSLFSLGVEMVIFSTRWVKIYGEKSTFIPYSMSNINDELFISFELHFQIWNLINKVSYTFFIQIYKIQSMIIYVLKVTNILFIFQFLIMYATIPSEYYLQTSHWTEVDVITFLTLGNFRRE